MTAPNPNIDLQQSEIKQIDATELQELIQAFKDKEGFEKIANNFDLNKDNANMSETENKILVKLYELGEINKQIEFLNNLANVVENRIPVKEKKDEGLSNNKRFKGKIKGQELSKETQKTLKEAQEKLKPNKEQQKSIKQINEITKNYVSLEDLLQNKKDRRKILKLDYPESNDCPLIKFKNGSKYLSFIKKQIAEKENKEIAKKLKGILPEEEINNILEGECHAENLRKKLKSTKKFNDFEVEELINSVALNKKTLIQISLRNKLDEKGINLKDFYKLKTNEERIQLLKDKGFSQEEQKEIIKKYNTLTETDNIINETDINLLNIKSKGYNKLDNKYFEEYIEDITYITDKQKLISVLKSINKKTNKNFRDIINNIFHSDINVMYLFKQISSKNKVFDLIDIKDFSNKNFISINTTNNTILPLSEYEQFISDKKSYNKSNKSNKDWQNKKLTKLENFNKKTDYNKLFRFLSIIDKDNATSFLITNYGEDQRKLIKFNINNSNISNKEYLNSIINKTISYNENKNISKNNDRKSDIKLSKFLLETTEQYINSKISAKDFDNFIVNNIKAFDQIDLKEDFITILTVKLIKNGINIYSLPRIRYYILKNINKKNIEKIINTNPDFYKNYLTNTQQEKYNIEFLNSLEKNGKLNIINISQIKIKNKKDLIKIHKKLLELGFSNFKDLYSNKNIYQEIIKTLTTKEKLSQEEKIQYSIIIPNFKDKLEEIENNKKIYNDSKIEKSVNQVKEKQEKNTGIFIKKGKEIGELITKYFPFEKNPNLQGKTIEIIKKYVDNPSDIKNLFNTEIASSLGSEKYKEFLNSLKTIFDNYYKEPIKIKSKEIKIIKEKYTDYFEITNKSIEIKKKLINDYQIKLEEEKELLGNKFDIKKFTEKYLEEKFGKDIDGNTKELLINKLIYKTVGQRALKKSINNDELITATVKGDKKTISKQLNNINQETYNDISNYNKQQKEEKNNLNNTENNKEYQIPLTQNTQYPINYDTREVIITENGQTEHITLTPTEILLIDSNPEMINNIVDFYKTLSRLGLKKLWTIKEQLFKSIGNVVGIGFQIDGDYLNQNEIKIFLNAILKSVGEKEIRMSLPLENFLGSIERLNKTQAVSGTEAIVDTFHGETYLENKIFNRFVPRNGLVVTFKFNDFEDAISGKNHPEQNK